MNNSVEPTSTTDDGRPKWRKSRRSGPWSDNCVEAAPQGDGVLVRHSKDPNGPVLTFTREEWLAFIGGVRDGDFDFGLVTSEPEQSADASQPS